jgi:hypothetical protein
VRSRCAIARLACLLSFGRGSIHSELRKAGARSGYRKGRSRSSSSFVSVSPTPQGLHSHTIRVRSSASFWML